MPSSGTIRSNQSEKNVDSGGRVGVVIGDPLDFSRYEGMEDDRFVLRSITDEIMYAIMELSGQEYVDLYAPVAKELAAKERKAADLDEVSPQA